jgi:hypothetical protein
VTSRLEVAVRLPVKWGIQCSGGVLEGDRRSAIGCDRGARSIIRPHGNSKATGTSTEQACSRIEECDEPEYCTVVLEY